MAEIVNNAQSTRKKDLYDHKSFNELYDYNAVISSLRAASKKSFIQYINSGVSYWKERFNILDGDFSKGYLAEVDLDSSIKEDVYRIRLSNTTPEIDELENPPKSVNFSIIEVADGLTIRFTDKMYDEVFDTLKHYIDLGLFPMITAPLDEHDIYDTFEKYDELCHPGKVIGTIVDVFGGADHRIFAVVMWDINYTNEFNLDMYECRSGTLVLTNAMGTPDVWKDTNVASHTNFAIPFYEFRSYEAIADMIVASPDLQEKINDLQVTGEIDLLFAKFLTKKLMDANDALASQTPTEKIVTASTHGVEATPISDDVVPDNVPVEDAEVDAEFARRMHLYDVAGDDFAPSSISDGIAQLTTEEILEDF